MSELVDEAEALQANMDGLGKLSDSLKTFNDSFASLLYVMDMNALTIDWPQAPTDVSFRLARRRAEEDARAAAAEAEAALKAAQEILPPPSLPPPQEADLDKTTYTENPEYETTIASAVNVTCTSTGVAKQPTKTRRKAKPKLSAKEKKERSMTIEKLISCLPLDFRGRDPNLRRNMETIIEAMMDSQGKGVKLIDLIAPPDLNQARVNKCLIALVNRKFVQKDSSTGSVLYHWHGLP